MEFCAKALIQPLLLSPSLFPSSSCTQSIIRKMILDIILCGLFRCTMVLLWYRWRRIITWFALINWQFVTSYNWRIWWNWPTFFSPFFFSLFTSSLLNYRSVPFTLTLTTLCMLLSIRSILWNCESPVTYCFLLFLLPLCFLCFLSSNTIMSTY